jgi:hypothetical protein
MESTVSLETLGIKMFARTAIQTGPVRIVPAHKGAGKAPVPASQNTGDNAYLFAKTAHFSIVNEFGYLILFQYCLHNFLAL